MAYIPKGAEWFLAEIIQEFQVEGESLRDVYINFLLVHAHTPEQAYERAIELGKEHDYEYKTPDGKIAHSVFRGLHNLHVIHDKLEHGAEILYEERCDLAEEQVKKLATPKHELNVFRPHEEDL